MEAPGGLEAPACRPGGPWRPAYGGPVFLFFCVNKGIDFIRDLLVPKRTPPGTWPLVGATPGCGKAGERAGSTCAIDVEGHKRRVWDLGFRVWGLGSKLLKEGGCIGHYTWEFLRFALDPGRASGLRG